MAVEVTREALRAFDLERVLLESENRANVADIRSVHEVYLLVGQFEWRESHLAFGKGRFQE
jgi:hypothetical protein